MVDPTLLLDVAKVAGAAFELVGKVVDVHHENVRARHAGAERREAAIDRAAERAHERELTEDLYRRQRGDKVHDDLRAEAFARESVLFERVVAHYPVDGGPGQLGGSLRRVAGPGSNLPVVLVVPPRPDEGEFWRHLPRRLFNSLHYLQDSQLAIIAQTDRRFDWPNPGLETFDLRGLPTIVTNVEVVTGRLSVSLGGCNLSGPGSIQAMNQVAWLPLPPEEYWVPSRVAALETSAAGAVSPAAAPESLVPLLERQMEWACRLAIVATVAALDSYHLRHRRGYAEQLDEAVASLSPDLEAGVEISSRSEGFADLPFHLLHQARRLLARGASLEAATTVRRAVALLAGQEDLPIGAAMKAAADRNAVEGWHRDLLEELVAAHPTAGLLDAEALQWLHRAPPEATVVAPARETPARPTAQPRTVVRTRANHRDAKRSDW